MNIYIIYRPIDILATNKDGCMYTHISMRVRDIDRPHTRRPIEHRPSASAALRALSGSGEYISHIVYRCGVPFADVRVEDHRIGERLQAERCDSRRRCAMLVSGADACAPKRAQARTPCALDNAHTGAHTC